MKNTTHFPILGKDRDAWKIMALIAALLLMLPLSGWSGTGGMAGSAAQNGSSGPAQPQKKAHSGHGYLGVGLQPSANRVLVVSVTPGGSAEKAGIQPGDIITELNKRPIKGDKDFLARLAQIPVGTTVTLTVLRKRKKMDVPVKMIEEPEEFVYVASGQTDTRKGNYDAAIAEYTKALEIDPQLVEAYNGRGYAYMKKGQAKQAISDFSKAIKLNRQDGEAYHYRGFIYALITSKYRAAISDLTKAIKIDPQDEIAYRARGYAYYERNYDRRSIADFTKAIELNPQDAFVYAFRYADYHELHMNKKAVQDYNKSIAIDPQYIADMWFNRAIFPWKNGDKAKAMNYLHRAMALDPSYIDKEIKNSPVFGMGAVPISQPNTVQNAPSAPPAQQPVAQKRSPGSGHFVKNNIEVVPYKGVSSGIVQNVSSAVNTIGVLLQKYGLVLNHRVYAVVTENQNDYQNAIAYYGGIADPQKAMERAETTGGLSLGGKPVVILKGNPAVERYPAYSFALLPHEIFHQVQYAYGVNNKTVPAWFLEGTAEFFRYKASEYAGLGAPVRDAQNALNGLVLSCTQSGQKLVPLSSLVSYTGWAKALVREASQRRNQHASFQNAIYPYAALSVMRLTQGHFLKIAAVLKLMKAGESFDQAFQTIFNTTVSDFEQNMTNSLNAEVAGIAKKDFGAKPLGITFKAVPQGVQVTYLTPGDLAIKAHMEVGDIVVAVDGHSVAGISLRQFVARVRQNPSSPLTLKVLRNNQKMEFVIRRASP